jgi:hypothetical protein
LAVQHHVLHLRSALPVLELTSLRHLWLGTLDQGVEVYGLVPFLAGDAVDLLLVEVLGTDIGITGESEFKVLFKKEIVSCGALIFYVVLQVPTGLKWWKVKVLH